jgi:autotransporter-associated beta strand protein
LTTSSTTANLSGAIAIDPAATLVFTGGPAGTFSGVISGSGKLVGQMANWTISGTAANTFSGTTAVEQGNLILKKSANIAAIAGPLTIGAGANAASVQLGANEQISPSTVVAFANNTSVLRLQAFRETVGGLTSNAGNGEVGNFGATGSTLTIAAVSNNTYGGALDDGFGGSFLALTESGTGTQTITGPVSFSGGVTVNSGTLTLSGSNTYLGTTTVNDGSLIATTVSSIPDGANLNVGPGSGSLAPIVGGGQGAPVASVPEPGTVAILAAALLVSSAALRRRKARRRF